MSWRAVATVMTLGASFFWLNDLRDAAFFVGASMTVNAFLYYIHERLWNVVRWGRVLQHQQGPSPSRMPTGEELASEAAVTGGD